MGTVSLQNGVFWWKGPFDERDEARKAGFNWHSELRMWYTESSFVASRLIHLAVGEAKGRLESEAAYINLSSAKYSNRVFWAPPGIRLREYQRAGVEYLAHSPYKGVILADEMGLGKTVMLYTYINNFMLGKRKKTLIVCPSTLRNMWLEVLHDSLRSGLTADVWTLRHRPHPGVNVELITYDSVHHRLSSMLSRRYNCIIFDEAHKLRNPESKRSRACRMLRVMDKIIFATGTPIINRPLELFSMLEMGEAHWLDGGWDVFAHKYTDGYFDGMGWKFTHAKNEDELAYMLRAGRMVRRRKADVLQELPDKIRQVVSLGARDPKTMSLLAKETKLFTQIFDASDGDFEKALKVLRAPSKEQAAEDAHKALATVRQELAMAKIGVAVTFIKDALASSDKILVFTQHVAVQTALREHADLAYRSVFIDGSVSPKERHIRLGSFRHDPKVKILFLSLQVGGEGLTLTESDHVIFVELPWTPAELAQAEDRCHRYGQKNTVLSQYLVYDNSLDASILRTLHGKQTGIEAVLDSQEAVVEEEEI